MWRWVVVVVVVHGRIEPGLQNGARHTWARTLFWGWGLGVLIVSFKVLYCRLYEIRERSIKKNYLSELSKGQPSYFLLRPFLALYEKESHSMSTVQVCLLNDSRGCQLFPSSQNEPRWLRSRHDCVPKGFFHFSVRSTHLSLWSIPHAVHYDFSSRW